VRVSRITAATTRALADQMITVRVDLRGITDSFERWGLVPVGNGATDRLTRRRHSAKAG
jgi:hypothetical protein